MTESNVAQTALRTGVDIIGIIFVPHSPRCVSIDVAKSIVKTVQSYGERTAPIDLYNGMETVCTTSPTAWFTAWSHHLQRVTKRTPLVVGVFCDESVERMNEIADEVGLDMIQLHGNEGIRSRFVDISYCNILIFYIGYEICKQLTVPSCRVLHIPSTPEVVNVENLIDSVQSGKNVLLINMCSTSKTLS